MTNEPRPTDVRINELAVHYDDDRALYWDTHSDLRESLNSGKDEGQILVRLDVDGQFDCIHADLTTTGHIQALDRSIKALEAIRKRLGAIYGTQPVEPAHCMAQGDWGRCNALDDHSGPHEFPTPAVAS